ncbi:hypothetical protein FOZ62_006280, partial [Perkinsus olseni]
DCRLHAVVSRGAVFAGDLPLASDSAQGVLAEPLQSRTAVSAKVSAQAPVTGTGVLNREDMSSATGHWDMAVHARCGPQASGTVHRQSHEEKSAFVSRVGAGGTTWTGTVTHGP